jgi:hypothetical protein
VDIVTALTFGKMTVLGIEKFIYRLSIQIIISNSAFNSFSKNNNVYKFNALFAWFPKRLKKIMVKQSKATLMDASSVIVASSDLPSQKRKEEAKQVLYIDRV